MIYVRIISTYPPVFGLPEETTDVTLPLRPQFAASPKEAHERIQKALETREVFEVPAANDPIPFEFTPAVVRSVAIWKT